MNIPSWIQGYLLAVTVASTLCAAIETYRQRRLWWYGLFIAIYGLAVMRFVELVKP